MKHWILGFSMTFALVGCGAPAGEAGPAEVAASAVQGREAHDPPMREGLPLGDPTAEGIPPSALESLVTMARSERSEALVILKNGKLVYEDYFGEKDEPIFAMSASKSFVGLAYGFLLADHKLGSLDEPVSRIVPSFASDPYKSRITYRQLLTQTSGIEPTRAMMEKPADILAHAERSRCLFEPGTSFQYSNNGVDFLAALAGKLAGKPMNVYLDEKLFRPLGIADIGWMLDDKGVPFGAGEMMIRPLDLAKVGAALATGGQWHGAPVVERSWIEQSSAVGSKLEPTYGLLWWRMAEVTAVGLTEDIVAGWRRAGAAETTLAKVASIVGRSFPSMSEYRAALHATLKPEELAALNTLLVTSDHLPYFRNFAVGPSSGIVAAGWLGQFLVVMPEKNLVGVRMRRLRESDQGAPGEVDGFRTFPTEVAKLVAAPQ